MAASTADTGVFILLKRLYPKAQHAGFCTVPIVKGKRNMTGANNDSALTAMAKATENRK